MQTYVVRIRYSETLRGRTRSFEHEVSAVERSPERAIDLALEYFEQMRQNSWVGWSRKVESVDARPARSRSFGGVGLTLQPLRGGVERGRG